MNNSHQNVSQKYATVDLKTRVDMATPHELINLLLQGAKTHIAIASGHMQRKQIKEKGEHIGKAINILEGLKNSLNYDQGDQVATNLFKLYNYIQHILLKANLTNNEQLLIESNTLLAEIHNAWQEIKTEIQSQ
ncbi:MAG: flagellar export chaperone FliS [bacterium]|nr:flagellar export chaperone FliS [bacterium]